MKYSIYLFIAGWMFLLGIMVGRGNAPVTFDTRPIQERLHTIVDEFGKKEQAQPQKVEPRFYDALKKPVSREVETSVSSKGAINEPHKEITPEPQAPPAKEKVSLKKQTYKENIKLAETPKAKPAPKSVPQKPKTTLPVPEKNGRYLLQIAAYREFKDAVAREAQLEKKGIKAYREKFDNGSKTWYRVRIGFFENYDDARKYKDWLKKNKINADIYKKDSP